jgi:hypothetical protein
MAIILQIVPVLSLSKNNQAVINTHWTYGHVCDCAADMDVDAFA